MLAIIRLRPFEAAFIAVWVGYFALLAIFRFESAYSNFALAIGYQVAFVAGIVLLLQFLPRPQYARREFDRVGVIAIVGLALSSAAILALFYAKHQAGVDYTRGLCQARYQMGGIVRQTSVFSVFGNLFGYAFFVPMVAVIVCDVSRRVFWQVVFGSFLCLLTLAVVTSSRSSIMLFIAFTIAATVIRLTLGRGITRVRLLDCVAAAGIMIIAVGYVSAVFACRAEASDLSSREYAVQFAPHLGLASREEAPAVGLASREEAPAVGLASREEAPAVVMNDAPGTLMMVALYAIHSAYTFDGVITLGNQGGHVLLQYPVELLSRVGLMAPPEPWVLSGRFVSLPGAVFHDYGLVGLVIGTFAIGLFVWLAMTLAARFSKSVVIVGGATSFLAILMLSPIHPATEFMAFPFISVSFLVVPAIAWVFGHVRAKVVGWSAAEKSGRL